MKIAIDLTSLSYHMSGIERYACCMTEEMIKQDLVNEYVLVFRNDIYHVFNKFVDNTRIKSIVLHGDNKLIFLQIILPMALYRIHADKFIFFAFTSPILFRKKGIINTIHDMGAWDSSESMSFFQKMYWRITYRISSKVSEKIITVSKFSKNRINDILKFPMDKIDVIYSGVYEGVTKDYGFTFKDIQDRYKLPSKYIMTLSTLEPRKNMELLLKAFTEIQDKVDYDLVLVGRKGWKMDAVIDKYNSKQRIHITGFVDDKHLSVIYKNALCFVFPSLYEGFGLPPVEALALGTPVIASDTSSIPEILRNQAEYFSNNSIDDLKNKLIFIKNKINNLSNGLDRYQNENYNFSKSAYILLKKFIK